MDFSKAARNLTAWLIQRKIRVIVFCSCTYRNASADGLTRNSADQIETLAGETGFAWIDHPECWYEFCRGVTPGDMSSVIPTLSPSVDIHSCINVAERNPRGFAFCMAPGKYGKPPYRTCARHAYVRDIEIHDGIPAWAPDIPSPLVCGSGGGGAKLDMRDFIYFTSPRGFRRCDFILPGHIEILEPDLSPLSSATKVGSAALGDVLSSRWAILLRCFGVPGITSWTGRMSICTLGVRCQDLAILPSIAGNVYKRVVPISDSCGHFVFTCDENGAQTMTDDSHIPCLAISKLRKTPRRWPSTVGGLHPLTNRELAHGDGGLDFWTSNRRSGISDHIVFGALCRSAPLVMRDLVRRSLMQNWMSDSEASEEDVLDRSPSAQPPGERQAIPRDTDIGILAGAAETEGGLLPTDYVSSGREPEQRSNRAYPETDTCPSQKTVLNALLIRRIYLIDPNDRACAERIERLRESIAAYGRAESVTRWNPHPRSSQPSAAQRRDTTSTEMAYEPDIGVPSTSDESATPPHPPRHAFGGEE